MIGSRLNIQMTRENYYRRLFATRAPRPRGLTLIELLLVLLILAILAGVAIRTTSGLADQARYEATQRLLTNLQNAVLGDSTLRQTDGSLIPNGFVNDIGAPPLAVGSDPSTQLSQLWEINSLTGNSVQDGSQVINLTADPTDSNVQLVLGWRGPYLYLSPGTVSLKDGWGNPLSLTFNAGVFQSAVSSASNNQVSTSQDSYSANIGTASSNFIADAQGTVLGRVQSWDTASGTWVTPASSLTVKLFYPINGHIARSDTLSDAATGNFSFSNVPVGLRALKVTDPASGNFVIRYVFVTKGGANQDLLLK